MPELTHAHDEALIDVLPSVVEPQEVRPEMHAMMRQFRERAMRLVQMNEATGFAASEIRCDTLSSPSAHWRRIIRRARLAVQEHGGIIAEVLGISRAQQMLEIMLVQHKFRLEPQHYYRYRLYDRKNYARRDSMCHRLRCRHIRVGFGEIYRSIL